MSINSNLKVYKHTLCFFLILAYFSANAQKLEWEINMHTFADNREYGKSYPILARTFFGVRFAPEIGVQIDSVHRLRAGFNALHEFGSPKFINNAVPILYYHYAIKNIDFSMGIFPRQNLLSDYPRALLNDTLNYFRPNVQGMAFRYENKKIRETVWIDWTSRQTGIDRETFLVGVSGKYKPGLVFLSHHAALFHNAGPAIDIPGDHVQDNAVATAQLGLDLSKKTVLDSLTISAGGIISFERTRGVTGWEIPKGALVEFYAGYKQFDLANSFYSGEGHHLINGDKFYTAKMYNRTDIGWKPISYKGIEGQFVLSYHFLKGVVDSQQSFNLRYNLGNSKAIKRPMF